jgi:hypothetical protein
MIYKCSKCKRIFKRKVNLEMHEKSCKGINKIIDKTLIIKKDINNNKKECPNSKTGLHDLVILRNINPIQMKAINAGYTAYCKICKELI